MTQTICCNCKSILGLAASSGIGRFQWDAPHSAGLAASAGTRRFHFGDSIFRLWESLQDSLGDSKLVFSANIVQDRGGRTEIDVLAGRGQRELSLAGMKNGHRCSRRVNPSTSALLLNSLQTGYPKPAALRRTETQE